MELKEQRAAELIASTVVVSDHPGWYGGTYSGGLGTVIAPRFVITTRHVGLAQAVMYAWKPEDKYQRSFQLTHYKTIGENTVLQSADPLPFPALPIATISSTLQRGATILWPGGYEFYHIERSNVLPIIIGYYNGPWGSQPHEHLAQGRSGHGTSGGGIYSLEDGVIVGTMLGITTAEYSPQEKAASNPPMDYGPDVQIFEDVDRFVPLHLSTARPQPAQAQITPPPATSPVPSSTGTSEQVSFWLKYKPYIISTGAGLIGAMIAKELM